jgi:hypothetical protein
LAWKERKQMSKVKMRCGRCGKTFTSTKGSKQIFCAECAAKERAARANAKTAPAQSAKPSAAAAPRIVGPGAGILDPRLASAKTTAAPPDQGLFGAAARAAERAGERPVREHGPERGHEQQHGQASTAVKPQAAASTAQSKPPKGERLQKQKTPRPPKPAPPTISLTDELREKIDSRYLQLAQPVEFDGIRTQIATELQIPKALVKKSIIDLRARMQLPSWWDLKSYQGSEEDLERIRAAYLPLLPVPPVGIHKPLAAELGLEPVVVYQGIRRIRAEMRLPQYNPPELHEGEQPAEAATTSK